MLISDNHILMTAGADMRALTMPLRKHNIDYFTYNKHYNNGGRVRLVTNTTHLRAFLERKCYLTGNIDASPKLYSDQVLLFSSLKNQALVDWLRQDFNTDHGIYIIKPSEEYTEFFSFAAPRDQQGMIQFYFNNLEFLHSFCSYFKEAGKDLIAKADSNQLILDYHHDIPPTIQTANLNDLLKINSKIKITPREQDVIQQLSLGLNAKEIGNALNLSHRTVEEYVANLKNKFMAKNKVDLVLKLQQAK